MIQAANVGIGIEGKVCLQRVVHTVYVVVCSEVCCMRCVVMCGGV